MIEENKKTEEREEKIKNWLKDRDNLIFLGIMAFALGIRLYYFVLTKNQPLWWDEADYMAYAKNLAGFNIFWTITGPHSSILPFAAAFFFILGLSEPIVRFFVCFIPSILLVYFSYEICILMYKDRRIALITSFLIATFWETLFNAQRFHVEGLGLLFGFTSIYVFWKGYERKEKIFRIINENWAIPLAVLFIILTYSSRRGYFLFGLIFLVYMLFTRKFSELIKDKYNWIALAFAISLLLIAEKFIFTSLITSVAATYYTGQPFSLLPFKVFGAYFENIFNQNLNILLYLFWIGLLIIIVKLAFVYDKLKDSENKNGRSNFFTFLMIFIVLAYFLFWQRRPAGDFGEPRWYYPMLLGCLICISEATLLITDYIKKYNKYVSAGILIILIGFGGYYELKHADFIIKAKLNSFEGIKDASLYVKEISDLGDEILSVPVPQVEYYAERKTFEPTHFVNKTSPPNVTFEESLAAIEKEKALKYIIITFSEPNHPAWMRTETYAQNPTTGQVGYATWQIPFMNTTIDFVNGRQDIKQSMKYDNIQFNLLTIKQDAFVYEIQRV